MRYIVTTTINSPTEATLKFSQKEGWRLIVVGDTKTPHNEYADVDCIYLSPDEQHDLYPELSEAIGWKTIQRRNIGFVYAYQNEADLIATVDDDNIPYENWGRDVLVGKDIECDVYECENGYFDPLSVTQSNHVWHRGYPIEHVPARHRVNYLGKAARRVLVQADLWDGDPDIDAIARLSHKPVVKYSEIVEPYCSINIAPFNSQNTFLAREVLPRYAVLPFVGRMDDIWGGYIMQHYFPNSVIYNRSSVYQDRNVQDLTVNLENEIIGYRNTLRMLEDMNNYRDILPDQTKKFWDIYTGMFE